MTSLGLCVIVTMFVKYFKKSKSDREDILQDIKEPTKIVVVEGLSQCSHIVQVFLEEIRQYSILGLDCEWVCKKKRNPVALLQLATTNGYCALFRLVKFGEAPSSLIDLLENNSIIKVGVGISSDVHLLYTDYQIKTMGFVDIDKVAKDAGFPGGSLKRMAKDILNVELDKKKSIQCGNWEAAVLSEAQIQYAALDALMPVKILERIMKLKSGNEFLDQTEAWLYFAETWSYAINVKHTFKSSAVGSKPKWNAKTYVEKSVGIKGPLYENCYLQDPDGRILTVCNNKKLNWYLGRGLGTEVSQSPRTVQLNFYPRKYVKNEDALYYTIEKENKCVVCGSDDSLRRKNVVPWEYRTHFPKELKDYKSHDVVLLCSSCHRVSVLRDQVLRQQLVVQCDAPVIQRGLTDAGRLLNKMKFTANALLKNNSKISPQRIEELKEFIRTHEKCADVTDELLHDIISRRLPDDFSFQSHGEKVVQFFQNRNTLNELEVKWRSHFLDTMKPSHLPELWSVHHNPWDVVKLRC